MSLRVTNKELKERALSHLTGNWGKAAIATLIMYLIAYIPSVGIDYAIAQGFGSLWYFVLLPLFYGYYVLFLNLSRTDELRTEMLFDGYKEFFPVFLTMLLKAIYIFLWSLLLIVPGIMKAYSYDMTEFIMRDNPDIRYDAAIEKSMEMMRGHRMQLFLLDLSMIGWGILCLLTLGIGYLFLAPYMRTSHAEFYQQLLIEEEENTF
ncbi:MAG: DUF975 family protein [Prevotella sp.]|nr:DUF975 family protein [Prevotella sp.]